MSTEDLLRTKEGTETHLWMPYMLGDESGWYCAHCMIVKQASGLHKPCRGKVPLALRANTPNESP